MSLKGFFSLSGGTHKSASETVPRQVSYCGREYEEDKLTDIEDDISYELLCGHMRRLRQSVLHMVIAGKDRRQDNRHQLATRKGLDTIPNNAQENTENDRHIRSPHSKDGAGVNREANVPDSTGPSDTEHHGCLEEFRNDVA